MKTLFLTPILSLAALLVAVPTANAERVDTRNCVAPIEYKSAAGFVANHHATRAALRAHWEVKARGEFDMPALGTVTRYPRCGYALSESFVFVMYEPGRDGEAFLKGIFVNG